MIVDVIEENSNKVVGKAFIAAFLSTKSKALECTRCGCKISPRSSGKSTIERTWDHWRKAHKTEFTKYALMGVTSLELLWWEPQHLPLEIRGRVAQYYVQLIGARL